MDPLTDIIMGFSLMGTWIFLSGSSLLSLVLFFMKKIYYRGDVNLSTIHASIRQAILLTIGWLLMVILHWAHIYETKLILTVWLAIGCIEVIAQAME